MKTALTAAATAIRAHDCSAAIEHLLVAFAASRSHALCALLEACSARASCWARPWVDHGSETKIWRMVAQTCSAAELSAVLAAQPDRDGEALIGLAEARKPPDPRLAHALLPIATGKRRAYLQTHDWHALRRALVAHADDVVATELARLATTAEKDAKLALQPISDFQMTPIAPELIAGVRAALAETPASPAREALHGSNPRVAATLVALAVGSSDERDLAFAKLESNRQDIDLAMPQLIRLLRIREYPDRARVLRVLVSPVRYHGFFETFPLLNVAAANEIQQGWSAYVGALSDDDPEVQSAALRLCGPIFIPLDDWAIRALYRARAKVATDPLVRAAFLVGAGRLDRAHSDRPTEWPLDDPDPVVAFAAAVCEALGRKAWITREALARLEAPPPAVDPRRFPWFDGDLPRLARETITWLELPEIEATLVELERAVVERGIVQHDSLPEWRARNLVPRVFGRRFDRAAFTPDQRRLVPLLAFYKSKELERLNIPAPRIDETRRSLGLAGATLRLAPSVSFENWSPAYERALEYARSDTEVPEIKYASDGRGKVVGLQVSGDISACPGLLEHCGVVALVGGAPLTEWIASGHRCGTLRVLWLERLPDSVERLAAATLLRQIRRMAIVTSDDATRLLGSPHLAELEALRWHGRGELEPLVALTALRELRLRVATPDPLATLSNVLGRMRAPLERLELKNTDVPIDVIAGNDRFAIRELAFEHCELRGGELFGAFGLLERLDARGSSFDDIAAAALASDGSNLREVDLRDTPVRALPALERLAARPAMTKLQLPDRVRIELWLSKQQLRTVEAMSRDELFLWRPAPRTTASDAVPEPPPGFERRFVYERDIPCGGCGGGGWTSEGHCPMHHDTEEVRFEGAEPYQPHQAKRLAGAATAVQRAEQLVAVIADELELRRLGRPRRIIWRFDRDGDHQKPVRDVPPSLLASFTGTGALAKSLLWPFERIRESPDDPIVRAAAAILELGFSIPVIAADAIHLGFHDPRT